MLEGDHLRRIKLAAQPWNPHHLIRAAFGNVQIPEGIDGNGRPSTTIV